MTRKIATIALAALTLFASACCKDNKAEDSGSPASSAGGGVTGTKGVGDPSNDKAVVDLAKPVLECKWSAGGFDYSCPALKAWNASDLLKDGKADTTLVNFLDDGDEKVRYLGASGLSQKGKNYRKDKALATRVLEVADKEQSKTVLSPLGRAVGTSDLKGTGLADRVKAMLESHKSDSLREALASNTLFDNREVPGMYELFVKLARSDKSPAVRKAAAAAFWTGTPNGKNEEVCKLWLELAGDKDSDLAGHSAYHCAFTSSGGGCVGQWDALLTLIEKQAKNGEVRSSFTASALNYFHGQGKASDAQKKRALEIAKTLVKNAKNDGSSRSSALDFIGKKDPQGKAFAAGFENDSDFFVKSTAKRIKEGK